MQLLNVSLALQRNRLLPRRTLLPAHALVSAPAGPCLPLAPVPSDIVLCPSFQQTLCFGPLPTDNSCINMVLERRTGIPITLSLVYMEVGGCWGHRCFSCPGVRC